jgi:hypothetical protein
LIKIKLIEKVLEPRAGHKAVWKLVNFGTYAINVIDKPMDYGTDCTENLYELETPQVFTKLEGPVRFPESEGKSYSRIKITHSPTYDMDNKGKFTIHPLDGNGEDMGFIVCERPMWRTFDELLKEYGYELVENK